MPNVRDCHNPVTLLCCCLQVNSTSYHFNNFLIALDAEFLFFNFSISSTHGVDTGEKKRVKAKLAMGLVRRKIRARDNSVAMGRDRYNGNMRTSHSEAW